MPKLMRCIYCGLLQDEPVGVKQCQRCGGELAFESPPQPEKAGSYLQAQMELDQVNAPPGQMIDRYLLVTLKTPPEVPIEHTAKTTTKRPPLGFHAVVDVSGSMSGHKITQTKQALQLAANMLHEGDVVSITIFSNQPRLILKPTEVNRSTREIFKSAIGEIQAGGMTALHGGLELGINQAKTSKLDNNLLLLLSDGRANVGETDLELIGQVAKKAANKGLVVSTLGVGMDYYETLMTEIATQGKGRYYHVRSSDQIVAYLTGELGEAANVAASEVHLRIQIPQGAAIIPFSAVYQAELVKGVADISIGDIPIDLEVEIPLRMTLFSGKEGKRLSITGEVQYRTPGGTHLSTSLNQVTVRFVREKAYQLDTGVVKPVVKRIARQMHASQVLGYSRAMHFRDPEERSRVEQERKMLLNYVQQLDEDDASKMIREMDLELEQIKDRTSSSKQVMSNAFAIHRSMRKPGGDDKR